MKDQTSAADSSAVLQPYLSPLAVWALSVGSAIGWGSLVVTSRTYLSQAGPLGSIVGLLISFLMMLMVARHYHFLANHYPGTGGLYNYVKFIFGYDRAFLVAWFMFLVYIAIFWANATSIPLFARYFLNDAFSVGYLYTIFGYEVYLGEALVTLAVIMLVAMLCMKSKIATARCMEILTLLFTIGITVCFVVAMAGRRPSGMSMAPTFVRTRARCSRWCASPSSPPGPSSASRACPTPPRNTGSSTATCSRCWRFRWWSSRRCTSSYCC